MPRRRTGRGEDGDLLTCYPILRMLTDGYGACIFIGPPPPTGPPRAKKPVKGLPGGGSRGVWCTMSYMVKATHSTTLTLDAQGRVLLPRPLRKALGLEPGSRLLALVEDGRLVLIPWERAEEELWAELADLKESLAEELLRERRLEAERDG